MASAGGAKAASLLSALRQRIIATVGGYREQADDEEGRDLRPEEYVDLVIGPAFGRNGSPDEANDDNHAGKDAVPCAGARITYFALCFSAGVNVRY